MEQEEDVVYLKVFDKYSSDVVFEGKVSTDVAPGDLVWLKCFWERGFYGVYSKPKNEQVKSFKGLQNNVELVAGAGDYKSFAGVLYVGAEDKVLRSSSSVPSSECVLMSVWRLPQEECEKVFKYDVLEELGMFYCKLMQIPTEIAGMKKLKKLTLCGLEELKSIEMGELSNLEEFRMVRCGVESLPKRFKELKMLKSFSVVDLHELRLSAEDLVAISNVKRLTIQYCSIVFTPPFTQLFWEMVKSTTVDLRVLELDWYKHNQEMVVAALEQNGSIVDGGYDSKSYAHFFERNKSNHERAMSCVVFFLAIRRWRNALNGVQKEMMRMIAMMLWITRCDVGAWSKN